MPPTWKHESNKIDQALRNQGMYSDGLVNFSCAACGVTVPDAKLVPRDLLQIQNVFEEE